MIHPQSYLQVIRRNKFEFLSLMATIILASTAIGVQRTLLAVYATELAENLDRFILLSAAITLSVYGMAKAIGNYLGGNLSDSKGRRLLLRIGLMTLVVGSLAILFATNLGMFLVANMIIGVGMGMFLASSTVMFADLVSSKYRARSISLMELSVYTGTSLGSILAGIFSRFGYLYSFAIAFVLVTVSIMIGFFVKETIGMGKKRRKKSVKKRMGKIGRLQTFWQGNLDGIIIDTPDLEDLFYTIREDPETETKGKLTLSQFVHPSILFTFSTGLISRISDTAVIIVLPLLIISRGFTTLQLGLITSMFTIMWAVGMFFSGLISDQVGRKIPVVIGLITEFCGLAMLLLPVLSGQLPIMLLGVMIAGFGRGTYYALPASIISDQVNQELRGKILGIYRFTLDFGYVIGSLLLVLLVEPVLAGSANTVTSVFEASLIVVIFLILVQAVLVTLMLKDPKPRFRQLDRVDKHMLQVQRSMSLLCQSVVEYASDNRHRSKLLMDQAKIVEQKADSTLEQIIQYTYAGSIHAVDAPEILGFSQKMDKALGHTLRGLRQLHLVNDTLPESLRIKMSKFAILLDFMMLEAVETINLLPVKISLAAEQSYHVNRLEEVLDDIHQLIWEDIVHLESNGLNSVLLAKSMESLEKGANTLEDAVQLIRLVAIKHNIV